MTGIYSFPLPYFPETDPYTPDDILNLLNFESDWKSSFTHLFQKAQESNVPYYVIKAHINVQNQCVILDAHDHLKNPTATKAYYFAFKCFNFENLKNGDVPTKTQFSEQSLEFFFKYSLEEINAQQMLQGTASSSETTMLTKKAQFNTAFYFSKGHGTDKNMDEATKWAWCAATPNENIIKVKEAASVLGGYYVELANNSKRLSEKVKFFKCAKRWYKQSLRDEDPAYQIILDKLTKTVRKLKEFINNPEKYNVPAAYL